MLSKRMCPLKCDQKKFNINLWCWLCCSFAKIVAKLFTDLIANMLSCVYFVSQQSKCQYKYKFHTLINTENIF